MVLEGDGDEILGKAAGHVPATALPGGAGNVVIAGHRDTFFRPLRRIRNDDGIIFTTTQGIYHYKVRSIKKVGPQDVQVLQASDHPELTLITCFPFDYLGPAPMRFVVQAAEIPSSPVDERDQSLARARPTPNTHAKARSISFTRPKEEPLISSGSSADAPATRLATTLQGSTTMTDGSESTPETEIAQQGDPPAESPSTYHHKRFGKIRAWLRSIPRRLRQD